MKKILGIIIIALLTTSCIEMSFQNPQPQGISDETSFPEKLRGTYTADSTDTIIISEFNVKYTPNGKTNDLDENISDSLVLRIHKNYFFVNIKDDKYWELYVLKLKRNNLEILTVSNDTTDDNGKLRKITNLEEIYHESGTFDRYLMNPTQDELMKMLKKGIFQKVATFKKVSKK